MKLLAVNEGSEAPHAASMSAPTPAASRQNLTHPLNPLKNLDITTSNQNLDSSRKRTPQNFHLIIDPSNTGTSKTSSPLEKNMTAVSNGTHCAHFISRFKRERTESESLFEDEDDLLLDASESSHAGQVLSGFNSLRRQGQLCDIKLVVEEHEYPAHRAVLATCSPYLFDVLTARSEESGETKQFSYKLKDISHVGFEYLLDFMYTSRMAVPARDVPTVYTTALSLKMESAVRVCATFLSQHLTTDNCLDLRLLLVKDSVITGSVDDFIKEHVDSVMDSQAFFGLTDLQVELVGMDEPICNEMMERRLFTLVMNWVKSNLNDLKPKIGRLTEQVNVLYLDSDNTLRDCADMADTPISSDDDMVTDYKIMARRRTKASRSAKQSPPRSPSHTNGTQPFHKFSLNPEEAVSVAEREWNIVATRKTNENVYFAIVLLDGHLMAISVHVRPPVTSPASESGSGPSSPSISSQLSPSTTHPSSPFVRKTSIALLDGMSTPRCAMGAVAVGNDQLVVCGGYDRGECLSSVEVFSISQGKWTAMPDMNRARGRFSASQLDGYVFVCGGSDGYRELSCVERYDPATGRWKYMASMLKERSSHGVTTLNGRLYVVGGCDGQHSINQCELYDPANNKWSKIAPLNMARSQTSVCAVNGLIFAIGGTDLWNTLNSVEVYDPMEDEWRLHSQLHIARRGAGSDIVNGCIVVVGGSDGAQSLVSTEILSPSAVPGSDCWSLGPSLTTQRANLSAVTLNSRLFAVGGFSGKKFLNTIEWLDMDGGEWFGHALRTEGSKVEGFGEGGKPVGQSDSCGEVDSRQRGSGSGSQVDVEQHSCVESNLSVHVS